MASYADNMLFNTMLKIFIRYVHISDADIAKFCNMEMEKVNHLYLIEDISKFTCEELYGLQQLMSFYMNRDVFNKNVSDDEEEYCWIIGKRIIKLLSEEHLRRLSLNREMQRKRKE